MTKYTIKKIFERNFNLPIWKIEVDCKENLLAIECRNPESTVPSFFVLDFEGTMHSKEIIPDEKEWTLEAVQNDFIILKKYGSSSPIQPGVQIIHSQSGLVIANYPEYVLQDVYQDYILATHRSIPAGLSFYISIKDGSVSNLKPQEFQLPFTNVHYPIPYHGKLPSFVKELSFEDQIWLQPYKENFLWSYHTKQSNGYALHLSLSSKNQIIDSKVILNNLSRLIPQPYFTVKEYIFFLTNTKQEIATYLV